MPHDLTVDVLASYAVDLLSHTEAQRRRITDACSRLGAYSQAPAATASVDVRRRCLDTIDQHLDEILATLRVEARLVMTMRHALTIAREDERRQPAAAARRARVARSGPAALGR